MKPVELSLRNKYTALTALFCFVLFLANCSDHAKDQAAEQAKKDSLASCSKPLNPNGDSELAVLMREMMSSAGNLKEMIRQGNLPDKFPDEFLKIHTAKPTDSDTKKASFEGFADNYISNLHALYASPKEELTQNYNAVINACASCHSQHCPGPLKAINKLRIN